jgi:AcrR family transcriptional regulator
MAATRRRSAGGTASRQRILDAAAEIAGERGYEGTSINLVSERSGLPASSIYWHFEDKDQLIAAVIDRSFAQWLETLEQNAPVGGPATADVSFDLALRRTARALVDFPDFLRLGLMLILERRPDELTARTRFLEVRNVTAQRLRELYAAHFTDLDDAAVAQLVTLTLALADGLFVAGEVGELPLDAALDLLPEAVLACAARLRVRP